MNIWGGVYDTILFLHILGVLLLVSGVVVAGVGFEAARRRRAPGEVALLLGLTRAGVALVGAGTVVGGVCGLWLVHLGHWGYGTGWVSAGTALFVAVLVLGGLGGQGPKRARIHAARLAAEGAAADAELRALLDDRRAQALNYASLLLLLVIVALMCFKP